ncbi:hypothetical protein [Roseibium sp.]|uniref:hypothetical protein n=1 Tax=Roseibium sp. TaxID=1936156 RepID=UPI003BAD9BCF
MGIRHVGGIREWGGYQRAKLVADMRDKHHLDASSISDRIGLSVVEVNRRYRAFKSLEQMQEDENYGEHAGPHMYPLFHEAVSLPVVREWLGWDADQCIFTDAEQREIFYQLISPRIPEVGPQIPPKLKSFSDIRALKDVLVNADAKNNLFQLDSELVDAIAIVTRDKITRRWRHEINEAKAALQNIPALEVEAFEQEDTAAIEDLINVANRILAAHRRAADI